MLHIAASFGAETEIAFRKAIEIDRLIDNLRETEFENVSATHEPWDCTLPLAGLTAKKCAHQEAVGRHVPSSSRLTLCFMCYFGVTDGIGLGRERLSFQCSISAASGCGADQCSSDEEKWSSPSDHTVLNLTIKQKRK